MLSKSGGLDLLNKAVLALLEAEQKAKPSDVPRLEKAWKELGKEYAVAANSPGDYLILTDEFKHSKELIKGIVKDRNEITADIKIATQILQALGPLVALL